ncbi:uncharacterized protein METZ01_LOCUS378924, partial [marine metagenome]
MLSTERQVAFGSRENRVGLFANVMVTAATWLVANDHSRRSRSLNA